VVGEKPRQIDLAVGETATFGNCRCGRCVLDLPLAENTAWFAGEVTAASGHWLLTNLCSQQALLVENLERPFEYVTVDAGRASTPIPFELSQVGVAGRPDGSTLTIFGPEPFGVRAYPTPCPEVHEGRPRLSPHATYSAVLRILCEPRLSASSAPLPTSEEIARRLGFRVTARAVDAHVDYLIGKLGLDRGCGRDVLVATAIRHRLITS
jgi:hypothetical protein